MSFYDDVGNFHVKFGLATEGSLPPQPLDPEILAFRVKFMLEELAEFCDAYGMRIVSARLAAVSDEVDGDSEQALTPVDVTGAADALADLVYVALGTAHMMGLPFNEIWEAVQKANMEKVRADGDDDERSKRGTGL